MSVTAEGQSPVGGLQLAGRATVLVPAVAGHADQAGPGGGRLSAQVRATSSADSPGRQGPHPSASCPALPPGSVELRLLPIAPTLLNTIPDQTGRARRKFIAESHIPPGRGVKEKKWLGG